MDYIPQAQSVLPAEAKATAAARGFSSVREWMRENRKAATEFRNRKGSKKERARLRGLAECLDREFERFNPHA